MIFVILLGASVFSLVFRGLGGEALVEEALRAMPGGPVGAMAVFMARDVRPGLLPRHLRDHLHHGAGLRPAADHDGRSTRSGSA